MPHASPERLDLGEKSAYKYSGASGTSAIITHFDLSVETSFLYFVPTHHSFAIFRSRQPKKSYFPVIMMYKFSALALVLAAVANAQLPAVPPCSVSPLTLTQQSPSLAKLTSSSNASPPP